ncbi:uncharacterized protein LOC132620251 [Lycium barbarum]|uniref:uncharacterized protein LOC132620251 n=1 Tax=Lycium barbarum TaxID=112863 RepID=UPI00293E450A|nr:uncharacterized protein LOC132620251 [Lycium barbarum]
MIKVDLQKAYDTVDWGSLEQVLECLGFPYKFIDDLLMFAKKEPRSIALLHEQFQIFLAASGLQANMSKSVVYYGGVSDAIKHEIQQLLGYNQGELPFMYLAIPLAPRKLKVVEWQPLIKIISRVSSWSTRKLSYAGRVPLVKSVLFVIQSYWAQMFVIPAKVMKNIEGYCRSFI